MALPSEEGSKRAKTSDEMITEFRQARSIDDKLLVMFQAQVDGQASNDKKFQYIAQSILCDFLTIHKSWAWYPNHLRFFVHRDNSSCIIHPEETAPSHRQPLAAYAHNESEQYQVPDSNLRRDRVRTPRHLGSHGAVQ